MHINWASTLRELRAYIEASLDMGVTCPCCNKSCKRYPHKLDSNLAANLMRLYHVSRGGKDREYFHLTEWVEFNALHYSLLRWWNLIEPQDEKSGYWRLTDLGIAFCEGSIRVPKRVWIYNNGLDEVSEETIDIVESLGEDFDYDELMSNAAEVSR